MLVSVWTPIKNGGRAVKNKWAAISTRLGPITTKMTVWFLFGVIVALLPVLFNAINIYSKGMTIDPYDLVSHGELQLVSVAVSAEALGSLFMSRREKHLAEAIIGGLCLLFLITASYWFAIIVQPAIASSTDKKIIQQAHEDIQTGSLYLIIFTVLVSAACKLRSE